MNQLQTFLHSPDLLIGFPAFSMLSMSDLTDCLLLWRLKTTFCLRVATSSPGKLLGLVGTVVVVVVVVSPETATKSIKPCAIVKNMKKFAKTKIQEIIIIIKPPNNQQTQAAVSVT